MFKVLNTVRRYAKVIVAGAASAAIRIITGKSRGVIEEAFQHALIDVAKVYLDILNGSRRPIGG